MGVIAGLNASSTQARRLPKLLTPGWIGNVELKNRIVMPPMTTRGADADGFVTPDSIAYYCERAEGGVGLITVEMAAPEKAGKHRNFELGLYDDRFLPGLTRLVEALHARGAKVSIQLGHGGGHTRLDITGGEMPVAPSAVPHVVQEGTTETVVPEAMTRERIEAAVEAFGQAGARAQRAGFDMVEIHAAHGYLISQFMAPAENRRGDEYGGTLENRARLGMQIIRRIKARAPGLPVIFRLSGDDFFPGGMTADEAHQVAIWAAETGADAIHVAGGHYRSLPSGAVMIPPMASPDATFLKFAARLKPHVKVPVIAVGRLGDPQVAIDAIDRGDADFAALGRPLLADPTWVERVTRGEPVRMCIACNTCVDGMREGLRLQCLVNPVTGHERSFGSPDARAERLPKGAKIAVVGAGPAGLSFASLVGARNTVTVFEKAEQPGGAFRLAGLAPKFQGVEANPASLLRYVDRLVQRCREAGVAFVFGCDIAADPQRLDGFDLVVLATGATYRPGLGMIPALLRAGVARLPLIRRWAADPALRDWFYFRARVSHVNRLKAGLGNRKVLVIGDAVKPGKSQAAIRSAFEAAYGLSPIQTE
ncbi:oxidoreductase [Xanthobacter wiegelii]|uniref:oxidoreductase n=1 Tax=Xanthobacter wiegelii TaxID=3119913 RepID=UPI003727BCFB